jgi:glycosyltransferase involved in cell wall biosynthesis
VNASVHRPTALQVVLSREFAGTERQVAELAHALGERGWRSIIAARAEVADEARRCFGADAELITLSGRPTAGLAPALARIIRRERVNVVNGHLGIGTAAALGASRLVGVPVVSTVHFIAPRHTQVRTAALQRPVYRAMLRRMDGVIAVSNAVAESARAAVGAGGPPVHVVHNGIRDVAGSNRDRHLNSASQQVVLFVGRLSPEKQPALLIEAMSSGPASTRLLIAGRGPQRERLRRLGDQLMPGRVELLGFVDDVDSVLRGASVLAIPSRAEPFGLVALEAMRAAVPVVGFAAGALPEIVEDGVTGLLVESGSVAGLWSALRRLLDDRALAKRLGLAGRRRFTRQFTAERMAAETESLYEAVIRRRHAAPVPA